MVNAGRSLPSSPRQNQARPGRIPRAAQRHGDAPACRSAAARGRGYPRRNRAGHPRGKL